MLLPQVVVTVALTSLGAIIQSAESARWPRSAFPYEYEDLLEFEESHIPLLDKKHVSYDFAYSVRDDDTGSAYSHEEERTGDVTRGEYRVSLPDGRIQIVSYVADENGYRAKVSYESSGSSPVVAEPLKYAPRPNPSPGYGRRRRPRPYHGGRPKHLHRPKGPYHPPTPETHYAPEPAEVPYHPPPPSPSLPSLISSPIPHYLSPKPKVHSIPGYVAPKVSYLPTSIPHLNKPSPYSPSPIPHHSTPEPHLHIPSPIPHHSTPIPYSPKPSYDPHHSTPSPHIPNPTHRPYVSDPTTIPNYITPANHIITTLSPESYLPKKHSLTPSPPPLLSPAPAIVAKPIKLPEVTSYKPKPKPIIPSSLLPKLLHDSHHSDIIFPYEHATPTPIPFITSPPPTLIPHSPSPYPTTLPHSPSPYPTPLPHSPSPYPTPLPHSPSPYPTPLPYSPSPYPPPYTPSPPPYPLKTPHPYIGLSSPPPYGGPSQLPYNIYRGPFFGPQYGPKFPGPSYPPRIPGFSPYLQSGPYPPRQFFRTTVGPAI
ncbi:uncharacterized protein [Palaemon carinicauda]|uniref:uncharacterized protein n=1 Tax=Palaemon carinicauda TaxID=392227 RepID=UPI0035B5FC5A